MSPLELIKQGILTEDWQAVREGYAQMTGQELTVAAPPKKTRGRKATPKQVPVVTDDADKFVVKSIFPSPGKKMPFVNKFEPEPILTELVVSKAELKAMAKNKQPRRPPARDYTSKIRCGECGGTFMGDSRDYIVEGGMPTGVCERCARE